MIQNLNLHHRVDLIKPAKNNLWGIARQVPSRFWVKKGEQIKSAQSYLKRPEKLFLDTFRSPFCTAYLGDMTMYNVGKFYMKSFGII